MRGAAVERLPARVNAVSPGWVSETLAEMGGDPGMGIPAAEVAQVFVRQLGDGPAGSVASAVRG